jgi:EAL domain-containing protein (putative c-di-GMP-specific phosphodiesterase class I)
MSAMRRLARMFGAIGATNEAILRAKTELELYQRVCDAAVHSGKSLATVALLAEPDSHWLKPVAGTGEASDLITRTKFSTDPDNPYGRGIAGQSFRTQKSAINPDIVANSGVWKETQRQIGVSACVAVPMVKGGKSIGVLMFFVGKSWAKDEEIVALFSRIAENVSFALDNFERAAEKARSDTQKHGIDAQTLTQNADMAMYLAKEDGKNGFRFFSRDVKVQSIERLTLETALRRALERDQFSLHYQPKVDMLTGQITGVEALLRWMHPDFGMVSPMQFIPLAEETGLIVPVGRWVLKEACAQNMAWQRRGLRPVSMAVNLSPRQFADPHLLQDIDEALLASGMSPVLLQLEVTESMVMRNVSRAIRVLDAIQSRGIRLAIDDFGTGHSSMSLMKQFPIDTIKIDRSFVRDLAEDPEDQAIAQAIISMGKALGMTVVAEGVETVEQQKFLREHGCDEMQGFIVSKPVPPRDLAELLRMPAETASPPLQPDDDPDLSGLKRTVV